MDSASSVNNALPFSTIIGAPFKAACDAQILLAKSTAEFIKEVGFVETDPTTKESETRNVDFSFIRPVQDKNGNVVEEKVDLQVPMLAIVNIPNMSIKSMDVVFDMEVKTIEYTNYQSNFTDDNSDKGNSTAKPADTNIQIHGKVTTHKENTRSSDNSAKYHVAVRAERDGVPEGLSRVLDILATSVAPRKTQIGKIVQEPVNSAPKADNTAPQPDNPTPQADNTASQPDNPTPQADNTAPQPDNPAPQSDNTASQPDNPAPQADNSAPLPQSNNPEDDLP